MGVYSVNTCKIIQVMVAYWYQGYWGVNSSGEGVSIYRGGKTREKRVFHGAENLENFEKMKNKG